jgi:lipoprotein-releasing system permease protein
MSRLLIKPFEAMLSVRFLLGKKSNNYISFTSWAAIIAMQLGVMTLIIVLSVMNGFRENIEQTYVSVDGDIQLTGDESVRHDWAGMAQKLQAQGGALRVAPYLEKQGLLLNGANGTPLVLRGVLPEQEKRIVQIKQATEMDIFSLLVPGEKNVLIGGNLARAHELQPGSRISLLVPQAGQGRALNSPDIGQFRVAGMFLTPDVKANEVVIFMHLQDLQAFVAEGRAVQSGLRVALERMEDAPRIANQIRANVADSIRVQDWQQKNATQYKAIQFEKVMMFIMLSLIVLISGFNIVTAMVMTVNAKTGEIAILMTMGARETSIARIFIFNGFILAVGGIVFGVGTGVLLAPNIGSILAFLERAFSFHVFDPQALDIARIPSRLDWNDVWIVALVAFFTSILSTIYPAIRASRVRPAQALRYE